MKQNLTLSEKKRINLYLFIAFRILANNQDIEKYLKKHLEDQSDFITFHSTRILNININKHLKEA